MFYYELVTSDGEVKYIPPQHASAINQAISSGAEHIGTDEKIRVRNIVRFRESEKRYVDESNLLEAGESVEVDNPFIEESEEGIKARAVKMSVPSRKLDHYQKSGYTTLSTEENRAWVAFWQPTHQISSNVQLCTPDEIRRLK